MKLRRLIIFTALLIADLVGGWEECGSDDDGSICPDHNTCCRTADPTVPFSCISGNTKSNLTGDCCTDGLKQGDTGCGQGYVCARNAATHLPFCQLDTPVERVSPPQLPRYRLCQLPSTALQNVYGLPMHPNTHQEEPQIPYYSTMGPLDGGDAATLAQHVRVTTVVVVIHGSSRNADDYLCCTHSALPLALGNSTVMVIAPWLRDPLDPSVELVSPSSSSGTATALEWAEEGPIPHTWRYGADAINTATSFGAYAVVDTLLAQLQRDRVRFPHLQRVVVTGHSAGGQYTQRWALLSNSPALDVSQSRFHVRIVVANPKSFCFLDNRRFVHGRLRVPSEEQIGRCPDYDQWEWGLSNDTQVLPAPYKDRSILLAGGVEAVKSRYPSRDVVYLAGELDVERNGDCRDRLQGHFRRERSERFFYTLREIYKRPVHHRLVVQGVHHDHCLMFQSPEGREALFGLHRGEEGGLPWLQRRDI
jgi:pimeloyl-ACP methyl ester carboxylesterase